MEHVSKRTRRDREGRFIKTCINLGSAGDRDCTARAGYYIDGWGQFGLAGMTGGARYCLKHARRALKHYQGDGHGYQRNTYRIREAGTHRLVK